MRALAFFSATAVALLALVAATAPHPNAAPDATPGLPPVASAPDSARSELWPSDGAELRDSDAPGTDLETERALAFLRSRHTGLSDRDEERLARLIASEARRRGLEPKLVLAVIRVESGGYSFAVSQVGALGLMQLMPATGEELAARYEIQWNGPETLFNPDINVRLGIAYLRELADRYGNVSTALAAYNWGPGRIDRKIRRGVRLPTRYINEVQRAYADTADNSPLQKRS